MNKAVLFVVLLLAAFICAINSQTAPPILRYRWKSPVSGDWHVKTNWDPSGIPRSGNHLAVFDNVGAGRYNVTQSQPILVGDIIVEDSVELLLNSTIGVLIDPNAIARPSVILTGQTLGFTTQVQVEDLALAHGTVEVVAVNIRTNDTEVLTLSSREDVGEFFGSFSTMCDGENPISAEGDGVLNALPFDIIRVTYQNGTARSDVVLAFMEPYQERLQWPAVSTSLMAYAARKTIRKLQHLKEKLIYILDNLPPYEANDCCPNEAYRYPLDIASFAERSYQFYTGNIYGPVGCEDLLTYTNRIQTFRDDLAGGMTSENGTNGVMRNSNGYTWTGNGLSFNWDDPQNWFPQGVPNSVNAAVHFQGDATVFLNRNIDIGEMKVDGTLDLYQGNYDLSVGGNIYTRGTAQIEELDDNLVNALEEKISIKTILQALFGDKMSS